jgi:hypothetical protein
VLDQFSNFPAGLPGVALLMLRLSAAALLVFSPLLAGFHPACRWLVTGAISTALVAGGMTRLSASLVSVAALWTALSARDSASALLAISSVNALALALLGPGAYSVDARIRGRRVVTLEP